ncbi:MAG: hypothetical protein Q8Q28_01445 [Pseudomonadota bacterium]|nr:hypothetical protein [Pseudomonadota bacterium]
MNKASRIPASDSFPSTAKSVTTILTDLQLRQRLIDQILRATLTSGDTAGSSRVERYLDAFQSGFEPQSGHVATAHFVDVTKMGPIGSVAQQAIAKKKT